MTQRKFDEDHDQSRGPQRNEETTNDPLNSEEEIIEMINELRLEGSNDLNIQNRTIENEKDTRDIRGEDSFQTSVVSNFNADPNSQGLG